MDNEMEMIRSRAMKLDDTTVTLQSSRPNRPKTKKPTIPLHIRGSATHLVLLKTILKVNIKTNKTPIPKKLRSLCTKLIISEAIMAVPPR